MEAYLQRHDYAVEWARANRDLLAYRIRECLFSTINSPFTSEGDTLLETPLAVESIVPIDPRDELDKILDVTHNSISLIRWEVLGKLEDVWVHRKGAAPTDRGFVPCPGSRGDFSWVLKPMGNGVKNGKTILVLAHAVKLSDYYQQVTPSLMVRAASTLGPLLHCTRVPSDLSRLQASIAALYVLTLNCLSRSGPRHIRTSGVSLRILKPRV